MPLTPGLRLYDSACDLLLAAQTVRSSAQEPDCEETIAATLACLGAALDELERATAELDIHSLAETLRTAREQCETARAGCAGA